MESGNLKELKKLGDGFVIIVKVRTTHTGNVFKRVGYSN